MNLHAPDADGVIVYARGLLSCSVCAPVAMSPEDVQAEVNRLRPSGTEAGWVRPPDETFSGGEPIPCPCNELPGRQHWLFEC